MRGGVEEALDRMASGLAARGHDVTLVCTAPAASREVAPDGVRFVRVKRFGALFRNPLALLAAHVPDDAEIVHVPGTYPLVSDLVPLREAGRRAVVLDYHFDVHGTSAAMRGAAALHRPLLKPALLRATKVLCKSLDYARASPSLRNVPPERLEWVPNGVDVDDFPLGAGAREGLLCVGRLVPYKGVDTLLRAMPRVHAETGARLTIVGDGPEAARLRALARQLDAPVAFAGRLPRAHLADAYARARVCVLPSANGQEAFGITLLESMAAGTPVVASDLPGVREVARLAGLTAKPQDAEGLAAALADALRDPARFGTPQEIRARVARSYSWTRVLDRLEAAYADALAHAPTKRAHRSPTRRAVGGHA